MHQAVQVIRGQHETVALIDGAPPAHHEVAAQRVLQRPGQVLVEDRVEVVVVRSEVAVEVRGQGRVRVVDPARVVVALPEFHRPDIGGKEYRAAWKIRRMIRGAGGVIYVPKKGLSGVDRTADMKACRKSIAEWGTENGWAKAWNAEPHVICQGAMYVTTNCTCWKIEWY